MDDAGPGRDHAQLAKGGLGPTQELVALAVALVLALDVIGERARRAELVDLDRVVDDQVGRDERIDETGVAAEVGHRVAHDREVDHGRDAGEILEEDAGGHERDLGLGRSAGSPGQEGLDVLRPDRRSARVAEQVLEQDLDRHRQRREIDSIADDVEPVEIGQTGSETGAGTERIGDRCRGGHGTRLLHRPRMCAGSVGAGRVRPPRVEVRR